MEDKEAKKIIDKMAVRFDDGLWEVVEKALKSKDGSATFTVGGDSRDVSVFRAVFEDLSIEDVTMEKDRAAGLLNCRITVPDEWREVYRTKRDDVKKRRKGVDEEYDFLRAAARLYGVVSIEDVDEILKHWRKELFDEEPLYPANKELYFEHISARAERLMLIAGLRQYSPFASVYVADDCAVSYTKYPSGGGHLPQDAKNSVEERKGKERWYPATLDGFLLWSYEQHRDGGTEYEALKDFIYSRWKLDRDSEDDAFLVEDVLDAMYDTLAAGRGWKAAVNVMRETFEFSHLLEKDFVRLTQLLCNAANATRQDANWGFTPNELVARRGMGGTYDIETTPTDFARNPNVPTVKATVKVGRNDPCPCGSGKKFKKCCGAGK